MHSGCITPDASLRHYPHAVTVLEAHVRHLGHLGPMAERYCTATTVARYLYGSSRLVGRRRSHGTLGRGQEVVSRPARAEWRDTAREGPAAGHERLTWLVDSVAPELDLRGSLAGSQLPSVSGRGPNGE
ncbi:hypothetical protein ABZ946_33465 [Streptomyces sp. NPDC046324]|uniref:hypothetical protein n=1 Tax=Streptomyces sp. NPDC046324 TaxID=3154915 RepID=UPI0033DB8D72